MYSYALFSFQGRVCLDDFNVYISQEFRPLFWKSQALLNLLKAKFE